MSECNVCVEQYTFRNSKVTCFHCNFESCRQCCKQFLLNSINDAKCMNCDKMWDREFLVKSFPYSFVDKEYKKYKENLLFEREKSKLPETQAIIEHRERISGYREKIQKLKDEIIQKREEIRLLERARWDERYDSVKVGQVKFFGHCPNNECKGFITSNWRCGLCEQRVCKSCKEKVGNEEDALKLHACNPDTLASLKEIKHDTKPCPKCKAFIFKISGCNQMWCTNCNVAFDWRTGEIYIRNIHNPHYFEWQRRTGGNINGNECQERIPYTLYGCCSKISKEQKKIITEMFRIARHIQYYEMPPLNNNVVHDNTLEYRIAYMTNKNDEQTFKTQLQRDDKKIQKNREKFQIFDMFVNTLSNYAFHYVLERLPNSTINTRRNYHRREEFKQIDPVKCDEFIKLIEELIQYTNESMMRIKTIYKNKVPLIEKIENDNKIEYVINSI